MSHSGRGKGTILACFQVEGQGAKKVNLNFLWCTALKRELLFFIKGERHLALFLEPVKLENLVGNSLEVAKEPADVSIYGMKFAILQVR